MMNLLKRFMINLLIYAALAVAMFGGALALMYMGIKVQ